MSSTKHLAPAAAGLVVAVAIAVWIGGQSASRRQDPDRQGRTAERTASAMAALDHSRERVLEAYANLPLAFVENRGQTDSRVRYYARGSRYAFYLTREEVVLSFVEGTDVSSQAHGSTRGPGASGVPAVVPAVAGEQPTTRGVALALRFLGGNPRVVVEGEERAPGEVNSFRGNDPSLWHTELARYARVVYRELWPGVDLTLRGQGGALKYEFRVRPGARLADIRLAYRGAAGLALDGEGALLIETGLGVLRDSPPVAYQEIAGVRVPVESRYVLKEGSGVEGTYGFVVGADYRPESELIIDPGVNYSTFLGGSSHDPGAAIAVDASGNAYVTGFTQSPDFPTTAGAFDRTGAAANNLDVFVSKLNATGTALVYSTFLGGSNSDRGRGIAIDAAGNAYVSGLTKSSNFPTTGGAFDRTFNINNCPRCGIDQDDAFVAKLNAAGSGLVYSTFLGGTDIDDSFAIAVDGAGNAYVVGWTGSTNFPTTFFAFDTSRNGSVDAFVTKLNASGSALVYSTFLGGSDTDLAEGVAIDAAGNAYVSGGTRSAEFPTTAGAFDRSRDGAVFDELFDVFVTKLNASGSALVYSTFLGGSHNDFGDGFAIDAAGNAYTTGGTLSADFPTTPGTFDTVFDNGSEGFVTKLNATGSGLVYSTFLGEAGASAITVDADGSAWLAGGTGSPTATTTPDAFAPTFNGGASDAYVAKLNPTGSALLYATFLGGSDSESCADIALDSAGNVYVTGHTVSADFPTTPGAFDTVFNGDPMIFWGDAFVTKFGVGPQSTTTSTTSPPTTTTTAPPAATTTTTVSPTTTTNAAPPTTTSSLPTTTVTTTTTTVTSTTAPADTVAIQLAEYDAGNRRLRVEATSTSSTATLTVSVTATGAAIGTLTNDGGGRYRGEFGWPVNPQNITVRSSRGGVASRSVTVK